jgi:hypothetical protein
MSDDLDTCPLDTCTAAISEREFACRRHWFELSDELRFKIRTHMRDGDTEALIADYAAAEAEWS